MKICEVQSIDTGSKQMCDLAADDDETVSRRYDKFLFGAAQLLTVLKKTLYICRNIRLINDEKNKNSKTKATFSLRLAKRLYSTISSVRRLHIL